MRRLSIGFALLLAACASAPKSLPHAETVVAFGWFGDLAGACWTGTAADGTTLDTQCYQWQFGRFLRGSIGIHGPHGNEPAGQFEGDSVFAWDKKANRIVYWFWGSDGNSGDAHAYYEGEWLYFPVPGQKSVRRAWKRLDADSFQVVREEKKGKSWEQTLAVVYRRQQ
jgi:hypothetical protein